MIPSSPSPTGYQVYRFPVPVKGIVSYNNSIVLLRNERDEWELPEGKLELGETPGACVVREIENAYQLFLMPVSA